MSATLSIAELSSRVGQEVGVSPWLTIGQQRVDDYARAINDPQWIHVDVERAKTGPFGGTIAHGFLTLAMLSHLIEQTFSFDDRKMGINYGLNRVRFTAPLPVGSRIRAHFVLGSWEQTGDMIQTVWNVTVEREGGEKPVLVAEWVTRAHI
ncbi:MAG: MaoC family dehydratase [Betaproteobacteria bacterium]|nr:MaoC family dehydratase [Betaproteobacteria bacterium]